MVRVNTTPPSLTGTEILKFWASVDKTAGFGPKGTCWEWAASLRKNTGYGHFAGQHPPRAYTAHRISFFLANDRWPTKNVCHECDNPRCVNPDHLFEGSQKDNIQDALSKQRMPTGDQSWQRRLPQRVARGEKNGWSKLDEASVRHIRASYESGESSEKIAARLGLAGSTVVRIVRRKAWAHVY